MLLLTLLSCFGHANGYKNYIIPVYFVPVVGSLPSHVPIFKHSSTPLQINTPFSTRCGLWITAIGALVTLWQDIFDLSTAVLAYAFVVLVPVPHLLMFIWVCYEFGEKFGLWQKACFCFSSIGGKRVLAQQLSSSLLPD